MKIHTESVASLGIELTFMGITLGAPLGNIKSIPSFSGQSYLPYSPVHLSGDLSGGDWTFNWVRRTRIGGAWQNKAWTGLPISQTDGTLDYELDIKDTSGTVLRTLTTTATSAGSVITTTDPPSALYVAADMATDFGEEKNYINIDVFQKDTSVGRGEIASELIGRTILSKQGARYVQHAH